MQSLSVRSFAKINWMLRILGRRPDGFHDLETIFQTISLHDVLTLRRADELEVGCDDPNIPAGPDNLVHRAAAEMIAEFGIDPVRIDIRKVIPAGGGLGGGSSNAAFTLMALDRMFSLDAPLEKLLEIAARLGSDVPFFLIGGTAWATGRGERLEVLPSPAPIPLLLLLPAESVGTAEAYRALSEARGEGSSPRPDAQGRSRAEKVMREGLLKRGNELENDFESVVFDMIPRLGELKEKATEAGAALVLMSGSGSTIFALFADAIARDQAVVRLRDEVRVVPCEIVTAHEAMRDLR
ncbi:MAG TPA: 4-(cytidine 5'-diphospho)-2-C-methyl-D-erythritol kinase [Thermoanaerobaculia bacterium]|nr:4-(cytidine 5'-diphospho)-2-C-methyl-D-erythritol kinase [Thermoanaerobaculia bacterium]